MGARSFTYEHLRDITDGFDESRIVGKGSYGVVYWGVHGQDIIAVKKLHDFTPKQADDNYEKELNNLRRLNHPNIVRMLGHCYHYEPKMQWHEGVRVRVVDIHRLLCFEYMSGSSLEEKITDYLPTGLTWGECYKIIRGLCNAIHHIHEEQPTPMRHMDIKPSNILLDEDKTAKLADFGLASIFTDEITKTTRSSFGSPRYLPPEYVARGHRSPTFDIFGFGVVALELAVGRKAYGNIDGITPEQSIHEAQQRWTEKFGDSFLESHCRQLKTCIQLGLECTDKYTEKRPKIQVIIERLENTENVASASNVSQPTNQLQRPSARTGIAGTGNSSSRRGTHAYPQQNYPSASTSRVVGTDNAMENMHIHNDNITLQRPSARTGIAGTGNSSSKRGKLASRQQNYPNVSTSRFDEIDYAMENMHIHDDSTRDLMAPWSPISFQFTHRGNSGVQVNHSYWISGGGTGMHMTTQLTRKSEEDEEEEDYEDYEDKFGY